MKFHQYLEAGFLNIQFAVVLLLLLLEAGDIESNPGPNPENTLSVLHLNIRSIRNKIVALNQIYFSFVLPILEYSSIVWDGCSQQDSIALDRLQNEAARIVTGLTRSVTLENLYRECGWSSLANRRKQHKLAFMYRSANLLVPSYISDLIPPI